MDIIYQTGGINFKVENIEIGIKKFSNLHVADNAAVAPSGARLTFRREFQF